MDLRAFDITIIVMGSLVFLDHGIADQSLCGFFLQRPLIIN